MNSESSASELEQLRDEVMALRQQVAAQQEQIAALESLQYAVFDNAPHTIVILEQLDLQRHRVVTTNPAAAHMFKMRPGDPDPEFSAKVLAEIQERVNTAIAAETTVTFEEHFVLPGREVWTKALHTPVFLPDGRKWVVISAFDISEQKQKELLDAEEREQIIAQQSFVLAELSTPLLNVSEQVVVLPLIGAIDSRRAQQMMETLLSGVERTKARVAIVDITGVAVVDTQVADVLMRAAKAVRLLGAKVILTGIRPEVAQTLVGLGADISDILTKGTLQAGIRESLRVAI